MKKIEAVEKEAEIKKGGKMEKEKVIIKSECQGSARYHLGKYKHWWKNVTEIDSTKSNGYAFVGPFLNYNCEQEVEVGSFIIEYEGCHSRYILYQVSKEGKQEVAEGTYEKFVTFRNQCQTIFGKGQSENENNEKIKKEKILSEFSIEELKEEINKREKVEI
jgi:hypothetical protein